MNKNKFRFWNPQTRKFVTNYKYNGYVDDLFEPDEFLFPQQFLGILDKNMKEIYEGDVVKGIYGLEGIEIIGEVQYSCNLCAYVVDYYHHLLADIQFKLNIDDIQFDSLEVVGNMVEDYMYGEDGKLTKIVALS